MAPVSAGWSALSHAARAEAAAFAAALQHPGKAQRDLLTANCESAFAKAHGFAAITTLADYQTRVPIGQDADFAAAIADTAADSRPRLTTEPPLAFERTGGSSGGAKLVPYNVALLASFRSATLVWLDGVLTRFPAITRGRFYATISPATRAPEVTASGLPIGLGSDAAYLGDDLARHLLGLIANPDEWRIATLAALIEAEDLTFISLWSPTFLLALIDALPECAEAVTARLSPPACARLTAAMAGGALNAALLWPMLACISCWTDGASAAFARALGERFPQAAIDPKGVLATEAPITITHGPDAARLPALTQCVTEFIDADGAPHLCDALSAGATYRAVITTRGGLYRYDIGDLFVCRTIAGGVPELEFAGRARLTCDLVGEKLEDGFVAQVLAGLPAVLAPRGDARGYELLVDAGHPAPIDCGAIERGLAANPQYAYARKIGQLEPLGLRVIANLAGTLIVRGIAAGRVMGDIKTSGLLPHPLTEGSGL
jgi:GH3 auxin-responsive promoter